MYLEPLKGSIQNPLKVLLLGVELRTLCFIYRTPMNHFSKSVACVALLLVNEPNSNSFNSTIRNKRITALLLSLRAVHHDTHHNLEALGC